MPKTDKLPKRSRWIKFGALAVLPAIALTACTTQENPAPTDTETSATAEPAPTSQEPTGQASDEASPGGSAASEELMPPEYPKGINQFTEDNAIKFVEFYIELINYATQTGDTALLAEYSAAECTFCNEWISFVTQTESEGDTIQNFLISVDSTPKLELDFDSALVFKLNLTQNNYWIKGTDSGDLQETAGSNFTTSMALGWKEQAWEVFGFGEVVE